MGLAPRRGHPIKRSKLARRRVLEGFFVVVRAYYGASSVLRFVSSDNPRFLASAHAHKKGTVNTFIDPLA